ncbi:DUF302 domain-containing protein [Cupriavidus sp. 2TAF22]|uniref:DUF302 domain-containing protein n=1 Tax=unclassified Cupriavidus TaxID=2640874 RepID=UPI003F8D9560
MARALRTTLLTAFWMTSAMTAHAEPSAGHPAAVLTLQSRYDFQTTIARFKDTLAARGVTLFADIDQSAAAAGAGMTLRPTRLLLFGNPKAGTPVMAANPHAALELPLRAVIWEDEQHATHIDYQDVSATIDRQYGIDPSLLGPLKPIPALLRGIAGQE